jgi:hypothetical protein
LALLGVFVLSLFAPDLAASDRAALLVMGASALVLLPFARRVADNSDASTWVVMLSFAVLYTLARRAWPERALLVAVGGLPDTPFAISPAAWLVVGGALISPGAWKDNLNAPLKALLAALALVCVLGVVSLLYLAPSYPIREAPTGNEAITDPVPLINTLLQSVEFAALGLCCAAATSHPVVRLWTLRALPLLLLAWARHLLRPIVTPEEE